MGFVDKSDRMVNSYGIACRTWKQTTKLFFSPNRHDHFECISYTQVMWRQNDAQKFHEILFRELIIHSQEENVTASSIARGRPSPFVVSQLSRLEVKHSQHWPSKGKRWRCHVCSLHKQTRSTLYFCRKCDVVSVHSELL